MSHLLTKIKGSNFFNRTMWEPHIMVYDNYILYKKRNWFVVKEITISYKQIAQVNLYVGLFFATLEIVIVGTDSHTVRVKFAPKEQTKRAKRIIDQKVHSVHSKDERLNEDAGVKSLEKSITRLTELLDRKKITKKEFEKKRKELVSGY